MSCNFEKLCSYVNDELDANGRQKVIAHMNRCEICLEAVCLMLEDNGDGLTIGEGPQHLNSEDHPEECHGKIR
jgi:hypothetical protein